MGSAFESWLGRLATKPLPGGVAAAAVAASMGSALVAKVSRIALAQSSLSDRERDSVGSVLALAQEQGVVMMSLAREDEEGFQAVLDTSRLPDGSPERRQAWQRATETPLQLGEGCRDLLAQLPSLSRVCLPAARVDLEVGCWLLEAGLRSGLEAARSNLSRWGDDPEATSLRSRAGRLGESLLKQPRCDGGQVYGQDVGGEA